MFGKPGLDRFNKPGGGRRNNMGTAPLQRATKQPGFAGGMMRQQQPMQTPKQPMMQNSVPDYIKSRPGVAQMPQVTMPNINTMNDRDMFMPKQPEPGYIKSTPNMGEMQPMGGEYMGMSNPMPDSRLFNRANMQQNIGMQRETTPNDYQPTREEMPPRSMTNNIVPQRPQYSRPQFMGNIGGANRFNAQMQNPFNNYNRMMQQQTLNNQIRGMGLISDAELRQRNGY